MSKRGSGDPSVIRQFQKFTFYELTWARRIRESSCLSLSFRSPSTAEGVEHPGQLSLSFIIIYYYGVMGCLATPVWIDRSELERVAYSSVVPVRLCIEA